MNENRKEHRVEPWNDGKLAHARESEIHCPLTHPCVLFLMSCRRRRQGEYLRVRASRDILWSTHGPLELDRG